MTNTARFELFSFWRTSATYRVRVAFNLKGCLLYTSTEARACGQKLCDEELLPSTWSIHDEKGGFVEDITRSDGRTLEQLMKDFRPNS